MLRCDLALAQVREDERAVPLARIPVAAAARGRDGQPGAGRQRNAPHGRAHYPRSVAGLERERARLAGVTAREPGGRQLLVAAPAANGHRGVDAAHDARRAEPAAKAAGTRGVRRELVTLDEDRILALETLDREVRRVGRVIRHRVPAVLRAARAAAAGVHLVVDEKCGVTRIV